MLAAESAEETVDDPLWSQEEADLGAYEAEDGLAKHGDERTEIILAATFLLIVVLSFIAWVEL